MTLKNWAALLIPALPPNPRDLQEEESSANGCLVLRKSVESNARNISRGAAPRRAKELDQEADAARSRLVTPRQLGGSPSGANGPCVRLRQSAHRVRCASVSRHRPRFLRCHG